MELRAVSDEKWIGQGDWFDVEYEKRIQDGIYMADVVQ